MTKLAFVDIETTGLNPFYHTIWEVGIVLAPDYQTISFQIPLTEGDLQRAEPKALEVGRYHERVNSEQMVKPSLAANVIATAFQDRMIIAQPTIFDLTFIRHFLWSHGVAETWSHRAVHDLKTLALGVLGGEVRDLSGSEMARVFGVPKPADEHRAISDALWNRDVYEAIRRHAHWRSMSPFVPST